MTREEAIAYVQAQTACATIEAMGMVAENAHRQANGLSIAYGVEQFHAVIERYGIHHNAVLKIFQEAS